MIEIVADIKQKNGKTIREENLERFHKIPLKTLIEVKNDGLPDHNGVRLWVVQHDRDCDGTPLYSLSFNKNWEEDNRGSTMIYRESVLSGINEESLTIISNTPEDCSRI